MLFTSDRGQPEVDAAERGELTSNPRRFPIMLIAGGYFVAAGLFMQWYFATTTLRCEPHASPTSSCVLEHHMLLGLVPAGTEHVTGVRSARFVVPGVEPIG